jgi:hypothetical protein
MIKMLEPTFLRTDALMTDSDRREFLKGHWQVDEELILLKMTGLLNIMTHKVTSTFILRSLRLPPKRPAHGLRTLASPPWIDLRKELLV